MGYENNENDQGCTNFILRTLRNTLMFTAFYIKLKPHNKSLLSLCSTPCNYWYVIINFQVHQVLCSSLSPIYLCMCVVLSFFFILYVVAKIHQSTKLFIKLLRCSL
jgi:hypothetical protein